MRYRLDGSVQTSNVPTTQNVGTEKDYALYRAMVINVLYKDDSNNITKNAKNAEVLYDVIILGGSASGQIVSNCRLSSFLGGNTSFFERTLQPTTKVIGKDRLEDHNGDIVYLMFQQGFTEFPVIIALGSGLDTSGNTGISKEDGPGLTSQFNGIFEQINNKGEWCFIRKGGTLDTENNIFVPNTEEPYHAEFKFLENIMVWKNPNSLIKFYEEEMKFEHIVGIEEEIYKEIIDGQLEKTTKTYKSGLSITEDGANDSFKITTNAGANIVVSQDKIAIGTSTVELLEKISEQLDKISNFLQTEAATHTHVANLGYPTAPPGNASAYISTASELATLKSEVDSIKGTI